MQSDMEETDTAGDGRTDADDLRRQLADVDDKWQRTAADLANLQKRFQREVERGHVAERERVLTLWLETLDDLERALAHAESEGIDVGTETGHVQGVRAIAGHAVNTIAGLGYPRVGQVGDTFDPMLHEVVSTIPVNDEFAANTVVAVVKPGYGTADHLLRPATVVVAKEPD